MTIKVEVPEPTDSITESQMTGAGVAGEIPLQASVSVQPSRRSTGSSSEDQAASVLTRSVCVGIILLSVFALWLNAFDQPLFAPDEGRYGTVSMHMAQGDGWLLPQFDGKVHIKKPPLVYWLQAASLLMWGHGETSLRMPSLLAASLTLLMAGGLGWRLGGPRVGAMAAGALAMMPLFAGVSHLAITDPLLTCLWFASLCSGFLAAQDGERRWGVLMWVCVGLGLLTKGPLALTPVGVILIWLGLARRLRTVQQLALRWSFLALIPIGVWVGLVLLQKPDAISVWYHEIVSRTVGTGDHPKPVWFYLPVFFAGLAPCTAMLVIPGWSISLRELRQRIGRAEPSVLLGLAVVLPLLMFSMISGKLATYLLPICPPMAVLTAIMLDGWLTGRHDQRRPGVRPPEVVIGLAATTILVCGGLIAAVIITRWQYLWIVLPVLSMPLASIWALRLWRREPSSRGWGLAAVWIAWLGSWVWLYKVVDGMRQPSNAALLVQRVSTLTGQSPTLVTYGFADPTLSFYNRKDVVRASNEKDLRALLAAHRQSLVLLVDGPEWEHFSSRQISSEFEVVEPWPRWSRPNPPTVVLRPRADGASASQPAPTQQATSQPDDSESVPKSDERISDW
jgi:4-amino-4-deoxy-L-arabinose transferase-like glycosyltransferase